MSNRIINISIDLKKIDKSKIKQHSNGASYYSITIDEKKEPDQFGNTHNVYDTQSKDERTSKVNKNYLGSGKEFVFGNTQQKPQSQSQNSSSPETIDDLPF